VLSLAYVGKMKRTTVLMVNKSNNKFFYVLLILIILISNLVIAEVVIRFTNALDHKARKIWLPNPYLGVVHTRNNQFIFTDNHKEFRAKQRTNDFGFMGKPITKTKPSGVFRIIILGDSFTEALQIEEYKNYCSRLEEYLNGYFLSSGKRFEVINAGISGYSPIQEYMFYKKRLQEFDADLVIVQLWTNDIFEDHKVGAMSLLGQDQLPVKINRYFLRKYQNRPQMGFGTFEVNPVINAAHNFLVETSRFYEYIYTVMIKANKNRNPHENLTKQLEFDDQNQFFIIQEDNPLYLNKQFRWRALDNTTRYLLALKQLVESRGAQLMLFYIPVEAQLSLTHYGTHKQLYGLNKIGSGFNEFLERFCGQYKIHCLDLLPAFEKNKEKGMYIHSDGHLNEIGQGEVSQALFDYLKGSSIVSR
jgi:hypothetical protein